MSKASGSPSVKRPSGQTIRLSGIVGLGHGGALVPELEGQVARALELLEEGLEALGTSPDELLRITVYVPGDGSAVVESVRAWLDQRDAVCAMAALGVATLPYRASVMLDAVAVPPPMLGAKSPGLASRSPQEKVSAPDKEMPTKGEVLCAPGVLAHRTPPGDASASFPFLLGDQATISERDGFGHVWRLSGQGIDKGSACARVRPFDKVVRSAPPPPGIRVTVPMTAPAASYPFQVEVLKSAQPVDVGVVEWVCTSGPDTADVSTFLPLPVWQAVSPSSSSLIQSALDPANHEDVEDRAFTTSMDREQLTAGTESYELAGPVRFRVQYHPAGSKLWLDSAPGPLPLVDLPFGPKLWVPLVRLREGDEVTLAW